MRTKSILGFGLEAKTVQGIKGTYIFFRTKSGSYHTFLEVAAKQAAHDCGAKKGEVRKMCGEVWNRSDSRGLKPPLWGRWIVKFDNKKCHLSCQNFAYALRYMHNGNWEELDRAKTPKDDKKMQKMLSRIEILQKAQETVKNISFWEKYFKTVPDSEISGRRERC